MMHSSLAHQCRRSRLIRLCGHTSARWDDLNGRKTACFLTQQLPFRFLAGNGSLATMEKLCRAHNGSICQTGIINWSNKQREQMITDLVEAIVRQF